MGCRARNPRPRCRNLSKAQRLKRTWQSGAASAACPRSQPHLLTIRWPGRAMASAPGNSKSHMYSINVRHPQGHSFSQMTVVRVSRGLLAHAAPRRIGTPASPCARPRGDTSLLGSTSPPSQETHHYRLPACQQLDHRGFAAVHSRCSRQPA